LGDYFKETLKKDKMTVKVEALKSNDLAAVLVQDEYMKRLQDMSVFMKSGNAGMPLGDDTLVLNSNHPLIKSLQSMAGDTDKAEIRGEMCQHVYDLARMAHQPLSGEALQQFLTRSSSLMARLV
jgi:molecular chaperone HtpG